MSKSSIKANKKKQEQRRQQQMIIEYYKRNPVLFVERELEVKLSKWQKFLLRLSFKGGFKDGK